MEILIIPPTYEVCGGIKFSLFRSSVPYVRSSFHHRVKGFALIIPPTYEVCGGIKFSLFRSSVPYVRSSFHHRVKGFALKFIRPHILKTL